MLNGKIKYLIMALAVMGNTACNERKIVLHQDEVTPPTRTSHVVKQPRVPIKEEILIKKNPNLGSRVDIPKNNPSLGKSIDGNLTDNNLTSEMPLENAGRMERIDFPVEEYKHIRKIGSSTVTGKVYLENSYTSDKIMGEKVKLYLNPVTSYSQQWYQESYLGGYKMSKSDPRLFNYLKFTMSDNSGKFNFFGVPTGQYYLVGTMKCGADCGFSEDKVIRLVKEISVGRGTTKVDLMKNVP
jgi:hypothetical protein